jgi:tol-pal system protein YbgF
MRRAEAVIVIVLIALLSGCVAQEADLRQTEKVLQQRIKQQDDQLSQSRARQGQEIATLRDQELPRLRGELERALYLAQDLQSKQEDFKHRLAQLEQHVKKMDADNTTRHAWVQKSLDTQDAKVGARLDDLSKAMETAMATLKKDVVEAVQRTNESMAKRVDARLEEQKKDTADNHQRLDQVSEKFAQFNQALTGFRDALTGLHDRVEQGEQTAGKTLESVGQKITTRLDEQDRRIELLGRLVESGNYRSGPRQQGTKSTQRSDEASPSDAESMRSDRTKSDGGEASAGSEGTEPAAASVTIALPKESPVPEPARGKVEAPDRAQYERVLALFRRGDLEGARLGFASFLTEYPNSDLAPNARYWQGEAYYGEKEYQKAIEAYDQVEIHYPRSEKVPAAILKKGYAYLALKDKKRASSAFKQVVTLYPKSPEAGKASDKLAQLKGAR